MALKVNNLGYTDKKISLVTTSSVSAAAQKPMVEAEGLINFATSNLAVGSNAPFKLFPYTSSGTNYLTIPAGSKIVDIDMVVHTVPTSDGTTTLALASSPDGTTFTTLYTAAATNGAPWSSTGFKKPDVFIGAGSSTPALVQTNLNPASDTKFYLRCASGATAMVAGIVYLKVKYIAPY
jgi:hypothetical protein